MSSVTPNTGAERSAGGRAFKPGPRWRFGAAAAVALAVAAGLVLIISAGTSNGASSSQKYGGLPKWLPKMKPTKPVVEVATANHPILSEEQGYTVRAKIGDATADLTALGPEFPAYISNYAQEGKWPAGKLVPSTFYFTLAQVHGTIPIRSSQFTVLTDTGRRVAARLAADGGGKLPSAVHTGQTVTFKVISKTVEGQGAIRWAPNGSRILAAWIYQLELD